VSEAPKSPESSEPPADASAAPGEGSPAAPEASVDRIDPVAGTPNPKVARMDVEPDAADPVAEHLETELTSDAVTVRRAPRYPAFIGLGVVLGALVALVLTFAFPESGEYDRGQVFGFLLLWCGAFGAALGGVTALVIERMLARRAGAGVAEHESTHLVEDEPS
jgi:hypothetical protein